MWTMQLLRTRHSQGRNFLLKVHAQDGWYIPSVKLASDQLALLLTTESPFHLLFLHGLHHVQKTPRKKSDLGERKTLASIEYHVMLHAKCRVDQFIVPPTQHTMKYHCVAMVIVVIIISFSASISQSMALLSLHYNYLECLSEMQIPGLQSRHIKSKSHWAKPKDLYF